MDRKQGQGTRTSRRIGWFGQSFGHCHCKVGVDAYTVMSYPKKESFFESLMNTNPGNYIKARMLKGTMGEIYQQFSVLENFDKCDRIQARVPFELNIQ